MKNKKEIFKKLTQKWHTDTAYMSDPDAMMSHPAYLYIISLGPSVLPLIFAELQKYGGMWYHALRELTGDNPVSKENAGKINEMRKDWLQYAKEKNIWELKRPKTKIIKCDVCQDEVKVNETSDFELCIGCYAKASNIEGTKYGYQGEHWWKKQK